MCENYIGVDCICCTMEFMIDERNFLFLIRIEVLPFVGL